MKSFITRLLSALVAVFILFGIYFLGGAEGFKILVSLAMILGSIELIRLFFAPYAAPLLKVLFYGLTFAVFLVSSLTPAFSGLVLTGALLLTALGVMANHARFSELFQMRDFCAKSALGYIYLGLLPSFAWRLLDRPQGLWWFLTLLAVVFAGDIGAYIFGSLWGRTKILPKVSPAKSWQGSIGGIFGSIIAILLCSYFSHYAQWQYLVCLAMVTAITAQLGDFFESLLKRVADLKDSGSFMPGHGGILDRIDGVLFAAPLFYFASLFLEQSF